jgi:hypothetical protein
MAPSILTPFKTFQHEGATVGRLLAGYSNLEIGLLHCVQVAIDDFDKAFKKLFGARGEWNRLQAGLKLGLPAYVKLNLDSDFESAVKAMDRCREIRNQYAHWTWWDDNSGQLAFANLEPLAKQIAHVSNFDQLQAQHVSADLLDEQEAYFVYVDHYLAFVNYEGRFLSGKLRERIYKKPTYRPPPALCI